MTRYTPQVIGVSADNTATLTNKTIDGDDNTLRDIATTSVKANNAGRVIVSGVMNPTLMVSPITITELNKLDGILSDAVGVDDVQILTNKSISDPLKVDTINPYTSGNPVDIYKLSTGDYSNLTISSGAITITTCNHRMLGEGGAADDLYTINGGLFCQILVLTIGSPSVITIKDGGGNLLLASDFIMNTTHDTIMLFYNGSSWIELTRSNNS